MRRLRLKIHPKALIKLSTRVFPNLLKGLYGPDAGLWFLSVKEIVLCLLEIEKAGDHDIRFVYRSNAFVFGIIITVTSLSGFILIIIFEEKLKKVKVLRAIYVIEKPIDETNTMLKDKK